MRTVFEVITGVLAVFGVYALLCRLVAWLSPKKDYCLAVRADGKTPEEVLLLAMTALLRSERDSRLSPAMVAFLEEEDGGLARTLDEMRIGVYVRHKGG